MSNQLLDIEEQYKKELLKHPLLSAHQERELLTRIEQGDKTARNLLLLHNQRLVMKLALKYYFSGIAGDQTLMDLVQHGNEGMLRALDKWDHKRKTRFSTYAHWWIRTYIRRGGMTQGQSTTRTSREADLLFTIRKGYAILSQTSRNGRPSLEALAEVTGLSVQMIGEHLPLLKISVSMDEFIGESQETTRGELMSNNEIGPEKIIEKDDTLERIVELMDELLTPDERIVLLARYQNPPLSWLQIGEIIGKSRTTAQNAHDRAIVKLRYKLDT